MYKLCRTEQSASRQRELEIKLLSLMEVRLYEDISVSDFCDHAGIPRKAFYRYFSSKDGALYALLDHTLLEYETCWTPYVSGECRTLAENLDAFFLFWKEHKLLLEVLENNSLTGLLLDRTLRYLKRDAVLPYLLPGEEPRIREQVLQFAVCGLMIMVINWYRTGFAESAQEMVQTAARLVTQPLFPLQTLR